MDELIFSGKYAGWEYHTRFDLEGAQPRNVAFALATIHDRIESEAFCHSGIDCSMIEHLIPEGNGIQDLIKFLEAKKPGEWKDFLLQAAKNREELLPVAESKFVCVLLSKNHVFAKVTAAMAQSEIKPQKQEPLPGQIAFIGRYKNWISIKKMSIEQGTKNYEIAGILSSINKTLVNTAFEFMNPDKSVDEIVANATRGKRKSFNNLVEALRQVAPSLTGDQIRNAYLMKRVFEALGFAPYANVEVLVSAYPELKVAKPRGRFSKK